MSFDLLTTVEYGGCSAKLSPLQLAEALRGLPRVRHPDLLVGIDTHDDASVYRISDELALVQTTDFFTPICSDPFEFGQIAAANALSDVWAMGGTPLTALNIMLFPATKIPLEVLKDILAGGQDKATEAGCLIVGGHTIEGYPPTYGMAVTGTVHPKRIVTNAGARPGDVLILSKAIGTGAIVAGQRLGEAQVPHYRAALDSMKQLNRRGGEVMQKHGIRGATDVTGFGLLGHGYRMASGSGVTFEIESSAVPLLDGAYELAAMGCIPGAAFRNLAFVEPHMRFHAGLDYSRRMLMLDAQTSGGLLMSVPQAKAQAVLDELRGAGFPLAAVIGQVVEKGEKCIDVY
jgi:selenide,water dikinase